MSPLSPILQILLLAFLCEGLVEYLARPVIHWGQTEPPTDTPGPQSSPLWLRYIAVVVGIALAIAYRADLLALVGLQAWSPWIGYIITGVIVGRGSNYLNDLADRWLTAIKP